MIKDFIQERAMMNSEKIFIIIQDKRITYGIFNSYVHALMDLIQSFSSKADRLLFDLSSNFYTLAGIIACNRLNVIPIISIPNKYRTPNIDYYKISNATHTLNDNNCIIQLKNNNYKLKYCFKENDVQCILFTSGSELAPKAVELTFGNIHSSTKNWNKIFQFHAGDKYLNILPLHHISGLSVFFRSIYYDFVQIIYQYNKLKLVDYISRYKINYISLVPKMICDIMGDKQLHFSIRKIKLAIIGGDAITKDIYDFLKNNQINCYVSYGMTETSAGISGYFINKLDKFYKGYIGIPHYDTNISLKNKYISIHSKTVMKKYVNGKICNKKFVTSDVGQIIDGSIYFVGRKKDFIVSGGENIHLKEIEKIVNSYSSSIDSVVIGYEDKNWGQVPIILFESNLSGINIGGLMLYCKKNLPKHMVPKYVIKINHIPKVNNKVDYKLIDYYITQSIK